MIAHAAPQSGDVYLSFNGRDQYVEIPSSVDYSAATTGALTVSAWLRPDTLNFLVVEPGTDFIEWLGKGDVPGASGNQEWTFRMYNHHDPLDSPSRSNRISFYLFNPQGGLGVGSFAQVPLHAGRWTHVVGVADGSRTYFYQDGEYVRCDTYNGPAQGNCEIHYEAPPNQNVQLVIDPQAGSAPLRLGTRDLRSFLEGGLTRVRLWSRALNATEILDLYSSDAVPLDGLVGAFMLNADTGTTAIDSAQQNDGLIVNATWATQE